MVFHERCNISVTFVPYLVGRVGGWLVNGSSYAVRCKPLTSVAAWSLPVFDPQASVRLTACASSIRSLLGTCVGKNGVTPLKMENENGRMGSVKNGMRMGS
jgi:hypothetical protein